VRRRLAFFIGCVRAGRGGHLSVTCAAGVFAEALMLEAMDMSNVTEWCEGEYELVVTNEGAVAGQWALAEVDELVGAVDILVAEQRSEWEGWDALGFRGCCSGVGGVVAAAAAAVAVAAPS
jgi:hypothetical protein